MDDLESIAQLPDASRGKLGLRSGDHSRGGRSWPHRWRWPSRPDVPGSRHARLVATAAFGSTAMNAIAPGALALARLLAFAAALVVLGAVAIAWWWVLAWLIWRVI